MSKKKGKEKLVMSEDMKKAIKKAPVTGPACMVRICEDADTGEIFTVEGKGCPPGTYEKLAHQAMKQGIQFRFKREKKEE